MTTDRVENKYPIFNRPVRANPQAVYAQMRVNDPIWRGIGPVSGNPFWFFTTYEDAVWALKEPRFIKDARRQLPPDIVVRYMPLNPQPPFDAIDRHMLNQDPPDHTRLRRLVHKAFTPRTIAAMQPRIEAIAHDLLDKMADHDEGDLLAEYAFPLPITVIAEMLGVHSEKRDDFRKWTNALLFGTSEEEARMAAMAFVMYINELIEERRATDTGDILSGLVRAEDEGETLDHMELLAMVFLLLVAGHETTVNLIGNGMLALMQHPDQMALLQSEPSLIGSAVEEMLRYNGPVEAPTLRWSVEDVEYKGHLIPQGEIILPSLLAANRDPAVFPDPDRFDITRSPNPHIAFGMGIHYCVGAPLARLEATIAIPALLKRLPNIRLNTAVADLRWTETLLIHGMRALPVAW